MKLADAVERVISICGADILEDRDMFLYAVEDLVPYLESELRFLKKSYDTELGMMLKKAYSSNKSVDQHYIDIISYLSDEIGLNEKKVNQYISFFPFLCLDQDPSEYNTDETLSSDNMTNLAELDSTSVQKTKTIEDYRRAANSVIEQLYGSPNYWDSIMEDPDNRQKIFFDREKRYWFIKINCGEYAEKTKESYDVTFQKAIIQLSKNREWSSDIIELLVDCSERNNYYATFLLGKVYRSYWEDEVRVYGKKAVNLMEKVAEVDSNSAFLRGVWSYMDWVLHEGWFKTSVNRPACARWIENDKAIAIKYLEKALKSSDKEIIQYSMALLEHIKAEYKHS